MGIVANLISDSFLALKNTHKDPSQNIRSWNISIGRGKKLSLLGRDLEYFGILFIRIHYSEHVPCLLIKFTQPSQGCIIYLTSLIDFIFKKKPNKNFN